MGPDNDARTTFSDPFLPTGSAARARCGWKGGAAAGADAAAACDGAEQHPTHAAGDRLGMVDERAGGPTQAAASRVRQPHMAWRNETEQVAQHRLTANQ